MPCDVCNHTVQNIGAEGRRIWWCPRCGSLKMESGNFIQTELPTLVRLVRDARDSAQNLHKAWAVGRSEWASLCEAVGREPKDG